MKRPITILVVFMLALAARVRAQVNAGEASMNLSGTISAGYTDDYSNVGPSDHSIIGAGTGDLSGSYYNPNFLSFDVEPFYNQSRLNSTYQSMTAASGVSASAKLFSGSNFPGSISYASAFNSSGNFGIPGVANYTTHGNTDTFAVNWGVHLDDLPRLNLSFSKGDNSYSVYGASSQGLLHSDTFSATTAYQIAGFNLNGGYQYAGNKIETPEFLTGELPEHSDSGVNAFSFGVGRNLPWNGSIGAGATLTRIHTNLGDTTSSDSYDTTIDTVTGALFFAPLGHLGVGANTYYTDNLEGTLYSTLLTAGVSVPQTEAQQSSHDLSLTSYANYEMPAQHLNLYTFVEHQQQTFWGISFASESYNGTATYSNVLAGGSFNGVLGLTRTSVETTHQSLLGLNSSVNYTHQIQRWTVAGALGYSQDTQTVLIAYTASGFNYSGSVGRRLGRRSYWGAYVSGARSVLTDEPGTANSSQSYSTSLSLPRFSISAGYSMSSGNALLTPTGLVATPVPVTVVAPAAVVLYSGRSYTVGVGSSPIRGLTLSAAYAKALSGTNSNSTVSNNNYENMYFLLIYQVRKLSFQAGYLRLVQGFSVSGTPQTMVGSFYVGISRWFNFF
jgi:hypothetical protein